MRCVCYECGIVYDVKPPLDQDEESHGLCDECFPIAMINIAAYRREKTNKILGARTADAANKVRNT